MATIGEMLAEHRAKAKKHLSVDNGKRADSISLSLQYLPVHSAKSPGKNLAWGPKAELPDRPERRAEGRTIHIELPSRALITAEHGVDPELLRVTLESLRK